MSGAVADVLLLAAVVTTALASFGPKVVWPIPTTLYAIYIMWAG